MKINLKRAVENLSKKELKFLQPMYEAITNSLEAGATKIEVNITTDVALDGITPKINGYSVIDNGEAFTSKNRDSFLELWSDKKIEYGCKGSGRITWLSVFSNIHIQSEVASENQYVDFVFSTEFDDSSINPTNKDFLENRTTISFLDVGKKFYNAQTGFDNRDIADIEHIKESIEDNMILKLFLMKKDGKSFSIAIRIDEKQVEISEKTIPQLDRVDFKIKSDITNNDYDFELYYHFVEDGRNSKKIYYCAAGRTVKEENDESLRINELPGKVSYNMLLCSNYLSERVNDSRDDFPVLSNRKQASFDCPLLYRDINKELLKQLHTILINKYPQLEDDNKEQEKRAIEATPFLAKYIRENKDIIKTEQSLIKDALKAFNDQKYTAKAKFEKLLKERNVSEEKFSKAVTEISEVALAELGEYILYRDSIIKALNESITDNEKKEKFVHDLFMPQNKAIDVNTQKDYGMTNLWLLDDKFMSFSAAFSDVQIQKMIESVFLKDHVADDNLGMEKKKPDLAVFYNKEISKDLLVIEFKDPKASLGEKEKSIGEIGRNGILIKEKIKDIDTIWAYIITDIDDEFEVSLRGSGYSKRFTNAVDGKVYYLYNPEVGHMFAIDIKTITADAMARNKTFLDILKQQ